MHGPHVPLPHDPDALGLFPQKVLITIYVRRVCGLHAAHASPCLRAAIRSPRVRARFVARSFLRFNNLRAILGQKCFVVSLLYSTFVSLSLPLPLSVYVLLGVKK